MSLLVIVPIIFLLVIILSFLLQWLWNMTMPAVFDGAKKIEFFVAFRLLLIGAILSSGGIISCHPN